MRFSSVVGTIALLIAICILWQIRFILLLGFAAVALATAINCLVKLIMRSGVKKRGVSVFLALFFLLLILTVLVLIIVPPLVNQIEQLFSLLPQAVESIENWLEWLQSQVPEQLIGEIQRLENFNRDIPRIATNLVSNFYGILFSSLGVLLNILLVVVLIIMLLSNPRPYMRLFLAFFPSFYRRRAARILKKSEQALVGWTQGILFNMSVITLFSWLGLVALGIRLPLVNALFAGLLTFIPNLGPALSCVPPTALALMDAPWKAVAVIILYFVIQQLEGMVLTPLVMKQRVSLLPAVTLLAQITFGFFFGFIGLFLALPLAVVAKVWIEEVLFKDILSNWNRQDNFSQLQSTNHNNNRNLALKPSPEVITTGITFKSES